MNKLIDSLPQIVKNKIYIIILDLEKDKNKNIYNNLLKQDNLILLNDYNIPSKEFSLDEKNKLEIIKEQGSKYYVVKIDNNSSKVDSRLINFIFNTELNIEKQLLEFIKMINEDTKFKEVLNLLKKV